VAYIRVCDDPIDSAGVCPTTYRVVTTEEAYQSVVMLDQAGFEALLLPTLLLFAVAFGIRAVRKTVEPKL
jgi:multisubunit Na+/H+ antiporter MnhF subunit